MTAIASHISEYLRERLPHEFGASQNTCDSYAYAFQLLFEFASKRFKLQPSNLTLEQIDAPLIMDFLKYLETDRNNSPRTRNARLVAIKSFMRFIEYRVPSLLEQTQRILAIPSKKTNSRLVSYLSIQEMQAILNKPDINTYAGIRDRAMIHLCFAAGLRVSELITLPLNAVDIQVTPSVHVLGKGRKERVVPLWKQTITDLKAWLSVRKNYLTPELFVNARGQSMTRSGFEYVLKKHVKTAEEKCPSLHSKRVTPHVLRHTAAMLVLQATGDIRKVSLWLGHADIQTTEIYLRADPTEKIEIIESILPPALKRGKFNAPDKLIELLHHKE
ncbi:MAG: tyrosine-type recombinase/integrase [Alteromonadaceae bacterium]|nr:tyrosine-type recombinase/integrase [Alteromonadaceae bacterium]